MFRFHRTYFLLALLLFFTEVLIALYAHDEIIRPYGGDFLVVIMIYCFLRSFLNTKIRVTAMAVLLFAYLLETLQYFHLVNLLGLQDSNLAKIILGTCFAWTDLFAYSLGISVVLLTELKIRGSNNFS